MASGMRSVGEPALLPRLWPTRRRRSEAQREYVVRRQGRRQGIRGVCGARLHATRPAVSSAGFNAGPELSHATCHTRGVISFRPLLAAAAALALVAQAETAPPPKVIPQELVDRQPAIIDAQVQSISQHSPPGSQAYFLGFAGVGEERVFAEEIDLAARRFADRFGLERRSLRLVNDQRDLEKYPLASTAALRYALEALGRVMDDDDVLFLALSSHGWKDATISVSNAGMRPATLGAKQ